MLPRRPAKILETHRKAGALGSLYDIRRKYCQRPQNEARPEAWHLGLLSPALVQDAYTFTDYWLPICYIAKTDRGRR